MRILDRFYRYADKYPDAVFIESSGQALTYRQFCNQLKIRSDQILSITHGRRCIVGFNSVRSIDSIISMLSIVEAGCIYFPTTNDETDWKGVDPELFINNVCLYDTAVEKTKSFNSTSAPSGLSGCAYVLKTSGTTGSPKSVFCPYSGIERLVVDNGYLDFKKNDSTLLISPLTFDASTFEVWAAVLNGLRLVVYEDDAIDLNKLESTINDHNVKILWLTSALFHLAVRFRINIFSNLRVVLSGGDVIDHGSVNNLLDTHRHLIFINGYGPTENTTFTACKVIKAEDIPLNSMPIGTLINGTWGVVLGADNKEVRPETVGELVVGGEGLACKILVDGNDSGKIQRLPGSEDVTCYRTGDQVYSNDQGELFFVGRMDSEIKRNGFRVNLTGLGNRISDVIDVTPVFCVFVKNKGSGQLVAAIQYSSEEGRIDKYQKKLRRTLKKYELPDLLIEVKQFPFNKNGKVDLNKLKEDISEKLKHRD